MSTNPQLSDSNKNLVLVVEAPDGFFIPRQTGRLTVGRNTRPGLRRLVLSSVCLVATGPTQPPVQLVSRVKLPGRDADHSSPCSAWIYTSSAPHAFA
jgi:hypothetical protein